MSAVAVGADISVELGQPLPSVLLGALDSRPRFVRGKLTEAEQTALRDRLSNTEHGDRVLEYLCSLGNHVPR